MTLEPEQFGCQAGAYRRSLATEGYPEEEAQTTRQAGGFYFSSSRRTSQQVLHRSLGLVRMIKITGHMTI